MKIKIAWFDTGPYRGLLPWFSLCHFKRTTSLVLKHGRGHKDSQSGFCRVRTPLGTGVRPKSRALILTPTHSLDRGEGGAALENLFQ